MNDDDDGRIYTILQIQPALSVVTFPAPCSTRADDKDRTPCLGMAVLQLNWYEYDQEDCSCCPYYDHGYVSQSRWACPECIPALLERAKLILSDYKEAVEVELDKLTAVLLAPSTAVPDDYEIREWKKKQPSEKLKRC